jgi:hypothetical protein
LIQEASQMRAITRITPSEPAPAERPRLAQIVLPIEAPADRPPAGRALVLVGPDQGSEIGPAGARPSAVFLAQLIATAQRAPQTRRRRRAEPKEVSMIYAAAATPGARMGRAFCRAL